MPQAISSEMSMEMIITGWPMCSDVCQEGFLLAHLFRLIPIFAKYDEMQLIRKTINTRKGTSEKINTIALQNF